ncbi:flagellar biosynthesis protein FlhB [Clostridiisalibacter paucivorans]|uniref:flagellar biosynthesis protein FlhB n=1 Tax=Clostridiisalibacter paucivorans TaxID=408753 RepID=UPI00047E23EA|nr:flagellar biosynthesis protein FlhB [Clostridiisalibacter paucivorans]
MNYPYNVNLQLFADEEKTEKPTSKKRKESREKGQVLQSKEINSALVLISVFLGLKIFGGYMNDNLGEFTKKILADYTIYLDLFNKKGIYIFVLKLFYIVMKLVFPIMAVAFVIGIATNYMQVGFLFTTKTLGVKFSRVNPLEGFKRIFSTKSIVELVKSFIKIFLLGYIIYVYCVKKLYDIFSLYDMSVSSIVKTIGDLAFGVAIRSAGVLLLLAVLDYAYQWWDYERNLKMSKQEVKEEYKQTEGDPQIKSKIKEKQRQVAMSRMMQDVPNADVIITNPTHYAIALKYNKELYDAPYVLAKGKDLIAENIKKIAKKSSLPIVENKPLARSLYSMTEIGDIIPEELYQGVAEILAYVYSLKS